MPSPQGVRHQQKGVRQSSCVKVLPEIKGEKHNQGRPQGQQGTGGVLKGPGGLLAQNQVPDDTAADGGGQTQDGHAQYVHVLFNAHDGAGNREGNGPDQFKDPE